MRIKPLKKFLKLCIIILFLGTVSYFFELVRKISPESDISNSNIEISSFKFLDSSSKDQLLKEDPIKREMKNRIHTLEKACTNHGLDVRKKDSLHRPNGWEYFISEEYNFVWCNVFKSGSSSWMHLLAKIKGLSINPRRLLIEPLLTLTRKRYTRPSENDLLRAMSNSTNFIIARDPFERLVSGYRDKIIKAFPNSYHDMMKKKIIHKFRRIIGLSDSNPTFQEFVRYILFTFNKAKQMDMHWTPVYRFCIPCQVHFTDIIKFETFTRDSNYILDKIGISSDLKKDFKKLNSAKDGIHSSKFVKQYLSELSKSEYQELKDFYQIDFDIFGYTPPTYEELHSSKHPNSYGM